MKRLIPIIATGFLLLFCLPPDARGQQVIGLPQVTNYPHEITQAGTQNWKIGQDRFGVMYFANNSGLLSFNSKEWKLFPLPNKTVLRSLAIAEDGRIYTGGQDAIGYFFPNERGVLEYFSLTGLLAESDRSFGDVWNIVIRDSTVFFRTTTKIYEIRPYGGVARTHLAANGSSWTFMGLAQGRLYAQNGSQPLVVLAGKSWMAVPGAQTLKDLFLINMLPYQGDTLLLATLHNGLFLMSAGHIEPMQEATALKKERIYTAREISPNLYALGTVSNGILLINRAGKVVRHFSTHNGLENNNIRSIYADRQGNLWAGLDEGVAMIDYLSPISKFSPVHKSRMATYTSLVHENKLYIGTSDGLYYTPLTGPAYGDISQSKGNFSLVPHSMGQVWSLQTIENRLFMGHHEGSFLVEGNNARFLSRKGGGSWLFRQLPGTSKILAGGYSGLQSLLYKNGSYVMENEFRNLLGETLRFVEIDYTTHTVWASHPYRGIYKITMAPDYSSAVAVKLYTTTNGLPGNNNNFVFTINGEQVFATENGIYKFVPSTDRFVPAESYARIFGHLSIHFMRQDDKGRIWFATPGRMGVVEENKLRYFPEFDGQLVGGFENIYPYNDQNIMIGSNNGLIHFNYHQYKQRENNIIARMGKVTITRKQDSVLFGGYFTQDNKMLDSQGTKSIAVLQPYMNAFHFEFHSNRFSHADKIMYSHKMVGLDNEWSNWTDKSSTDYTNLPHGEYRFEVMARDNLGNISAPASYSFIITPFWYQTRLAYSLYALLVISGATGMFRLHSRRLKQQRLKFEKEEAQLKYLHELELERNERELERNEREIIKLKNDHLETEVRYKNKELASTTMHLYKRGRLLTKIKEELSWATEKLAGKEEKKDFIKLLKLISAEEKSDNDWEQFSIHFDEVHNSFLQHLKAAYPDLTPTDMKICAYIKMNLSSKEMAQLLSITIKGVEIARYRLRKKLQLTPDVNLADFIAGVRPKQ